MAIIRLKDNHVTERFMYKYLISPQFIEYLNEIQSGSAQPQINLTNLKEARFAIPPLKTQQKTVQYLEQLSQKTETLKQVQTEKMESLKALKASILDRAFRGEI